MNRLTKKHIHKKHEHKYYTKNNNYCYGELVFKLGQLEDIEEQIGIDLINLFTNKEVYCKCDIRTFEVDKQGLKREKIIYDVIKKRKLMSINIQKNTIQCGNVYSFNNYKIKDYGKTWALTKEELENE